MRQNPFRIAENRVYEFYAVYAIYEFYAFYEINEFYAINALYEFYALYAINAFYEFYAINAVSAAGGWVIVGLKKLKFRKVKTMTRNGKIARLSAALRKELNERLEAGKQGKELVKWLNSLPAVQNLIRYDFRGQPISEQNLSQWKNGGYRDWQEKRERWDMLHQLREEAEEMGCAVDPEETQRHLSVVLTLELGRALRDLMENTADVKERVRGLDRLIGRFAQLRREESHARRVDLEWKRRRHELGGDTRGGFGPGTRRRLNESEQEKTASEGASPGDGTNGEESGKKSPVPGDITEKGGKKAGRAQGKARSRKSRTKRIKADNGEKLNGDDGESGQAASAGSEQIVEGVSEQSGQSKPDESQRITVDQSSGSDGESNVQRSFKDQPSKSFNCGVRSAECGIEAVSSTFEESREACIANLAAPEDRRGPTDEAPGGHPSSLHFDATSPPSNKSDGTSPPASEKNL